jgi:UDP-2-acetamido-3-amino-2,3-dideoxy-glucuronate N-acetyltransferase
VGWMSRYGERLKLPLDGNGEAACPHTGERYRLVDRRLEVLPPQPVHGRAQ